MRNTPFCICENKDDHTTNQQIFRYIDCIIPLLHKSQISRLDTVCCCTARFVSDLVGNPEDRFCRDEANLVPHENASSYRRAEGQPAMWFNYGAAKSLSFHLLKSK